MKDLKRGTPAFGILLGAVLVAAGALIMWIGFWRTLILVLLFAVGYFLGAVQDKAGFVKGAVDRVVPEKKEQTIDFRKEVEKEQDSFRAQQPQEASEAAADGDEEE